jgi:hypothetical protein
MARPTRAPVTGAGAPVALVVGSLVFFLALIGACVRLAGEWLVDRRWGGSAVAFAGAGALFWLGVVVLQGQPGPPA